MSIGNSVAGSSWPPLMCLDAMHVVGLRYENASGALEAGALIVGATVNFRHKYVSAEHPDAYAAYCSRYKIGFMPRFGSRLLMAAGYSSPITSEIRAVSGSGKSIAVVVEIRSPFSASPSECSLTRPTTDNHGVYAIVNVLNMKAYIGCTGNFELRRRQHLKMLEQGEHFSHFLQRDWKQSPSAFAFVRVDVKPPDMAEKEQLRKYISSTEDPAFGYNQGAGFAPTSQPRPASEGQSTPTPIPSKVGSAPFPRPATSPPHRDTGFSTGPATSQEKHPVLQTASSQQNRPSLPSTVPQDTGCLVVLAISCGFVLAAAGVGVMFAGLIP